MQSQARFYPVALVIAALSVDAGIGAEEEASSRNGYVTENFALGDDDLSDITSQVMAQHPLLSSSPGVKYAGATRHRRSQDIASIIYHPHTETAGIKQAFQVTCSRRVPEKSWHCDEAEIRRYVALDSQEFEVRITGPIEFEESMALIEATREALPAILEDGSASPQTVTMIMPYQDGYLVSWGDRTGQGKLLMWAQLPEGADPKKPTHWMAKVYSPDN